MESQPQNPEFRKNLENFHPCNCLSAGELGIGFCHLIFSPRNTTSVSKC